MPRSGLRRPITEEEVATYEQDGVVHLREVLDDEWLELLSEGLHEVFYEQWGQHEVQYDMTARAREFETEGRTLLSDDRAAAIEKPGRYLSAISSWTYNDKIREAALRSPLPEIAGVLFRTDKVNYYDDQVLLKEAGAREYTAFHTDEPYYHLAGDQVCGIWVSPYEVGPDNSPMRYVRGSHTWGSYLPNSFVSQLPSVVDETRTQLPDIEGNEDHYDIVTIPSEPGDVIVHHSNLIHGSSANYDTSRLRWASSFRYAGADVRYLSQSTAPPQPHHHHDLSDGDPLDCDQFPVVWRRPQERSTP